MPKPNYLKQQQKESPPVTCRICHEIMRREQSLQHAFRRHPAAFFMWLPTDDDFGLNRISGYKLKRA